MGTINSSFVIEIPVANTIRFTIDGEVDNQRANFDQVRYSKANHATVQNQVYTQLLEKADTQRIQFYTNFPESLVQVVDCYDDVLIESAPSVLRQYRGKKYRSDCKFTSIDDKLFIFFDEGVLYTDEDFLETGELVVLSGRLPNINAQVGDKVRYNIQELGFFEATITAITWNPDLQCEGYLTDADVSIDDPVDGVVEITYDEKNADLYQQEIDFSGLDDGEYFVLLRIGIGPYSVLYKSEPLFIQSYHKDTLAIEYGHTGQFDMEDQWSYIYDSGWRNIIRMPATHYEITPSGDIEAYVDDFGIQEKLRSVPFRQIQFKALNIPGWLVDKLNIIFSHDTIVINDYYWENENFGQFNYIDKLDLGTFEVNLRQKNDRRIFSKDVSLVLSASFNPEELIDLDYEEDTINIEFVSNTPYTFSFDSLPSWISANVSEFSNGDIIELTVLTNPTTSPRSITLTASSDDTGADGLTATLEVSQVLNSAITLWVNVSDDPYLLPGSLPSQLVIDVDSSGDYDILVTGAALTVTKQSGFSQLLLEYTTTNVTAEQKETTVRLTLQADPAYFVEFTVKQETLGLVLSFSHSPISIDPSGSPIRNSGVVVSNLIMNATPTAQWQASSPVSWVIFGTSIGVGTLEHFPITAQPNNTGSSRSTTIRVKNVNNPSNFITLFISQSPT